MHKPPEPVTQGATFDLAAIDGEMRREAAYERNGYLARTLVRTPDLRVVFMVMKAKSSIAEHQAGDTASVHVLSGAIRLGLPSRTVELGAGQLLVLEAGLRHDVEADEDSAFLLTIGWHGER